MKTEEPALNAQDAFIETPSSPMYTREPLAEGSARTIFRVLSRYRWYIVLITLLFVLLGFLYAVRQRPVYTAQALTALNVDKTNGLSLEEINTALPGGTEADLRLETEVRILQSDSLALNVIQQLGLKSDPDFRTPKNASADAVQENMLGVWHSALQVKVVPKTKLLQISFSSHNPHVAANVVNALLLAYAAEGQKNRLQATEEASESLATELAGARQRAETAETRLTDYQKTQGILLTPGTETGQQSGLNRVEDLNRAYTIAQVSRIEKQAAYQQIQSKDPQTLASLSPDSALSSLRDQRASLAREVAEVDSKFGPEYPRSKQLHSALVQIDASIAAESTRTLNQLRQGYQSAQSTEDRLKAELDRSKAQEFQVNSGSAQMQVLQQEATSARQLYENLLRRLSEANAMAGLQQSTMQVVDQARVPTSPSSKGRRVYVVGAFLAGLFFSLGLALVLNALADTAGSAADVHEVTGLSVLGSIPTIAGKQSADFNPALVTYRRPRSRVSEAFHTLRTSLLLSGGKTKKVIAITSPGAGEGKSIISLNLAVVLAQRGATVLLIDADLRCARLHDYAKIRREPGLSDILESTAEFSSCVSQLNSALPLSILPAGPPSSQPADLLDSPAMSSFIAFCREQFDFVIIDTPPALVVSDLSIIGHLTDGILLVARSGVTQRRDLAKTSRLLATQGEWVLGIVMNEDPELSQGSKRNSRYFNYYEEVSQ